MLDGGCDPLYIVRRLIRVASEDIGNADPRALQLALNAWEVFERLGSPEGELAIGHAVAYLACAPKSNAVYKAFTAATADAKEKGSLDVPMHLRNAPTGLMKDLGYGDGYRYAHDEGMRTMRRTPSPWVKNTFLTTWARSSIIIPSLAGSRFASRRNSMTSSIARAKRNSRTGS
jgi:replication-associated recombination protein RarA